VCVWGRFRGVGKAGLLTVWSSGLIIRGSVSCQQASRGAGILGDLFPPPFRAELVRKWGAFDE